MKPVNFAENPWTEIDYEMLIDHLRTLADEKYKAFNESLIPGVAATIGVRMPFLREIAKEIIKGDFKAFIKTAFEQDRKKGKVFYNEELMLLAMVIGACKCGIDETLHYVEKFVPLISNWAVNDTFAMGLKIIGKHPNKAYPFILSCLESKNPWAVRFGFTCLMCYYNNEDMLDEIFAHCDRLKSDHYYVQMAVAWCLSVCFVKFPDRTFHYLSISKLDPFTYNKALQKIIESRRVDPTLKDRIRQMKRQTV